LGCEVAVRLRVMGYQRQTIEQAISEGAASKRSARLE
jgi:hypothetical protein